MAKHLLGWSYRDLEGVTGIHHTTFIKFRKRLMHTLWFSKVFKLLASQVVAGQKKLNLIVDSSFAETYSKKKEQGSAYSGYKKKVGFKLHSVIDYVTRLPLMQVATPGNCADITLGKHLIRGTPRSWNVKSLTADKGYDCSDFVHDIFQGWHGVKIGIQIKKTSQKTSLEEQKKTQNYKLKAKERCLSKKLYNTRSEIERYYSRKKGVFNLGEERTRHLKNFRVNCYTTSIMEILEWMSKNSLLRVLFSKLENQNLTKQRM